MTFMVLVWGALAVSAWQHFLAFGWQMALSPRSSPTVALEVKGHGSVWCTLIDIKMQSDHRIQHIIATKKLHHYVWFKWSNTHAIVSIFFRLSFVCGIPSQPSVLRYTCEEAALQNIIPEFHWGGPKAGWFGKEKPYKDLCIQLLLYVMKEWRSERSLSLMLHTWSCHAFGHSALAWAK